MAGFDFNTLLQNPQFLMGAQLLGNRSPDAMQQAIGTMMQMQQLKQKQAEASTANQLNKMKLEEAQRKKQFSLAKFQTPAQPARPAQDLSLDTGVPLQSPAQPASPASTDWQAALSEYLQAGGDPNDMAAMKKMMEPEAAENPYMAVGGNSIFDKRTGEFKNNPQLQEDQLARIDAKAEAEREKTAMLAGLKADPYQLQAQRDTAAMARKQAELATRKATGGAGRPLSKPVINQIQESRAVSQRLDSLAKEFQPKFAGKGLLGQGGDLQLKASGIFGKDQDSVAWWKDYRKNVELVERKAMFGATLTNNEQTAWSNATIEPGMDAETIRRNVETRAALAKKVLDAEQQDFIDAYPEHSRAIGKIGGRSAVPQVTLPGGWSYKGSR